MESLARLVVILMLSAFLGGPIAIGLTRIKTKNVLLTIVRRLIHAFFIAISVLVGAGLLINREVSLLIHLIGLYAVSMSYIALRREYFPEVRIIAPILAKFGVKLWKKQKRSGNERGSSHFGPVVKWRRGGHSGGNDGHGPEGQH
jgi:hypothetical protein